MDLPDLLQEGVVLHNGGVCDFVDLIMYAGLVPGRSAVTVGDLTAEELFDLTGLLDKQFKRVRDRCPPVPAEHTRSAVPPRAQSTTAATTLVFS